MTKQDWDFVNDLLKVLQERLALQDQKIDHLEKTMKKLLEVLSDD
jgi:flagellar biosynthesis chaperone FliJ